MPSTRLRACGATASCSLASLSITSPKRRKESALLLIGAISLLRSLPWRPISFSSNSYLSISGANLAKYSRTQIRGLIPFGRCVLQATVYWLLASGFRGNSPSAFQFAPFLLR